MRPLLNVASTDASGAEESADTTDPLKRLEEVHLEIQNSLASDLLQAIKEEPQPFLKSWWWS